MFYPLHTLTLFGWHANEQWNRKCYKIPCRTWPHLFNLAKSFALKLKLGFKFCQFSGRSGNSGLPPSHQPSVDLRISLYLASAYICICVFVFLYFPRIWSENSGRHPPSPLPACHQLDTKRNSGTDRDCWVSLPTTTHHDQSYVRIFTTLHIFWSCFNQWKYNCHHHQRHLVNSKLVCYTHR